MRYSILLIAFALVCAFSFAQEDQCASLEEQCGRNCCEPNGGTTQVTTDYITCEFPGTTSDSTVDLYHSCAATQCREPVLDCYVPGSPCGQGFSSCYSICISGGSTAQQCDDSCLTDAMSCVQDYTAGSQPSTSGTSYTPTAATPASSSDNSCCGSVILILFGMIGAFAFPKN